MATMAEIYPRIMDRLSYIYTMWSIRVLQMGERVRYDVRLILAIQNIIMGASRPEGFGVRAIINIVVGLLLLITSFNDLRIKPIGRLASLLVVILYFTFLVISSMAETGLNSSHLMPIFFIIIFTFEVITPG